MSGGNYPCVAPVLRRREHQVNQILTDVRVGKLNGARDDAANPLLAGISVHWKPGVDARGEHVLSNLFQTDWIAEPGEYDLSQVTRNTAAENASDRAVFADDKTGQRTSA